MSHDAPLLTVENLCVHYGTARQPLKAVDGISLSVRRGECVGLVGESGCGKSTLGRAILRLEKAHSGRVTFAGEDVLALRGGGLKTFRRRAQMVFQDPYGSLNPRISIGGTLEEVLKVHGMTDRQARRERSAELLREVGLRPDFLPRYPHEFSGGQRQRIGIARALAVGPELIVADEPVSALDVSVQVQVLNLLRDIQQSKGISLLFVAHDLAVVRYVSQRVFVMYLGRIVEYADASDLFAAPAHPYTTRLLSAVPDVEKGLRKRSASATERLLTKLADGPDRSVLGEGCAFAARCPIAVERCRKEVPVLQEVTTGHFSACHRAQEHQAGRA